MRPAVIVQPSAVRPGSARQAGELPQPVSADLVQTAAIHRSCLVTRRGTGLQLSCHGPLLAAPAFWLAFFS